MCQLRHSFFGLTPTYKLALHRQIFELAYHSKGAFNQDIVYNLPIYLRNFYYNLLAEALEKENNINNQSIEDAENKTNERKVLRGPSIKK